MLFPTGTVVATPGVLASFTHEELLQCLRRHVGGDWGDLCEEDVRANADALKRSTRLFSRYDLPAGKLWIITEADRSATTFLLPEEY